MTNVPERSRSKIVVYALLSWPPHVIGYVVAPLFVARRDRRRGWSNGRPGRANLLGIGPLVAGAGLITWAIASHYRASPGRPQAKVLPNYLVTAGAYGVSRNPLYVGGAAMWMGWAVLFGSVKVAGAGVALFTGLSGGVRAEEQLLSRRFGDEYRAYRRRVPRWLKLP
jgi:protein-S-isoprenylcysteine O-methyltransferase Ste14